MNRNKTKSVQVMKLNTGRTTIICKKFIYDKDNPFRVYRVECGHTICIARYSDLVYVLAFCRELVLEAADYLTLKECKEWAKENG